jgi:predicted flap endonuclease-1-like 5' DNA nuclease
MNQSIFNVFKEAWGYPSAMFFIILLVSYLLGLLTAWLYWHYRMKGLQARYDALKFEYDKLVVSNKDLIERDASLTIDIKRLGDEKNKLGARLNEFDSKYQSLDNDYNNLKRRLIESDGKCKNCNEEVDALKQRLAEMQAELDAANSKPAQIIEKFVTAETHKDPFHSNLQPNIEPSGQDLSTKFAALEVPTFENPISLEQKTEIDLALDNNMEQLLDASNTEEPVMELPTVEEEPIAEPVALETPNVVAEVIIPQIERKEASTSKEKAEAELTGILGASIPMATADTRDDLKLISGIGAFIEKKLNNLGIYQFKQIAQFDSHVVQVVTDAIEFFPGRIERDNWVGQATELMNLHSGSSKRKPLFNHKLANGNDDLKIVEGIGPKIEELLHAANITTFAQLATTDFNAIREILDNAGTRFRMNDPSSWGQQALLAANEQWEKLKELQDILIGGRSK